ncbi:hypothetical protein CIPAW_09G200200 [Carya illinoinensis]|uniref:Uncharacterized protein n=1 Tax=Carya illinoinensis TaxID=32201 RepID=A0A8T1PG99_CARIL|nr:hypothetical protein CIPAW_09G200200 [Carya illinoinensis]
MCFDKNMQFIKHSLLPKIVSMSLTIIESFPLFSHSPTPVSYLSLLPHSHSLCPDLLCYCHWLLAPLPSSAFTKSLENERSLFGLCMDLGIFVLMGFGLKSSAAKEYHMVGSVASMLIPNQFKAEQFTGFRYVGEVDAAPTCWLKLA